MTETKKLLNQIEYLRRKMSEVVIEKGLTSNESLKISQELDRLLNVYDNEQYHK